VRPSKKLNAWHNDLETTMHSAENDWQQQIQNCVRSPKSMASTIARRVTSGLSRRRTQRRICAQRRRNGLPIARIAAITSLSCGAILNLGICRYAGKGQSEISLLRRLWDILRPGDVLLTDCLMSTWKEMLLLKERGIDSVSRLNKARRQADFRRGTRLSEGDDIVRWLKPNSIRSVDWQTYKSLHPVAFTTPMLVSLFAKSQNNHG
jgi:hypothetical protein